MKVAISTDDGFVSAHFGRCPSFTIADIDNGKLTGKTVIDNPGHHPGFLPRYLRNRGVDLVVAGGAGQRALALFADVGIKVLVGVSGGVDDVLDKIVAGTLKGGESFCKPRSGKGYGLDKTECDHQHEGG